jgi:hypothetical protein
MLALWNGAAALENELSELSSNRAELVAPHGCRGNRSAGNRSDSKVDLE